MTNERILVSRNKREGKYAGRRRYSWLTPATLHHTRGGKDGFRHVLN